MDVEVRGLGTNLVLMGHNVSVLSPLCTSVPGNSYDLHLVHPYLARRDPLTQALNEFFFGLSSNVVARELSNQMKLDILHFYSPLPALFYRLLNKIRAIRHIPSVFDCGTPVPMMSKYGGDGLEILFNRVSLALHSRVMREVDRVIVNSTSLKSIFAQYGDIDESRIEVVPAGVDSSVYRPCSRTSELKPKYDADERVILVVGAITPIKNQLSVVKSIPDIARTEPTTKFVFAGAILSHDYCTEIQKFVWEKKLGNKVILAGELTRRQLLEYYAIADLVVFPSVLEGCSRALLEAMSCAKAIVAYSTDFNREVAKEGNELIFVRPFDTKEMSQAVIDLLDDHEGRRSLGRRARDTVLRHFDWKIVAGRFATIYETLI